MIKRLIHSWQKICNLIFPPRCLNCQAPETYLCANCASTIPLADNSELINSLALFNYSDKRVKKLIWLLKYRGAHSIAPTGAKLLYEMLLEQLSDWQMFDGGDQNPWLLIAIPLDARRQKERGFNQSGKLAQALRDCNPKLFDYQALALTRIKSVPSQVSVATRAKRLKNLQGVFRADPATVRGRRVIVIDDVITTGATMTEARRALKKAGARSVLGLAIAHG